jgi:hypothetical protein
MNMGIKMLSVAALLSGASVTLAQEPPAPVKPTPQSEAGEPRASTSPATPDSAPPAAPVKSAKPGKSSAVAAADGSTRGVVIPGQKGPGGSDRLDLGTATVTGDREQPKVMYIVPWKRSDIGDLAGKPMNSLVDEILAPVDRDVFKREVVYYKAVQADASQKGAPAHPSDQGEK